MKEKKCPFSNYLLILTFSIFRLKEFCCGKVQSFWIVVFLLETSDGIDYWHRISHIFCRLKFNGFTSRKNLCPVNTRSLWRISSSCSAKRTVTSIFFYFFLNFRSLAGKTFSVSICLIQLCSSFINPNPDGKYGN